MIRLSNRCGGILSFTLWMSNSFTSYSEGMDARICTCGKIAAYLCVDYSMCLWLFKHYTQIPVHICKSYFSYIKEFMVNSFEWPQGAEVLWPQNKTFPNLSLVLVYKM